MAQLESVSKNSEGASKNSSAAIVQVQDFSFAYQGAEGGLDQVFQKVSFKLKEGDFCLLVGPTGCGKTTLLRSMKPELAPAGERSGTIEVLGRPLVRDGQALSAKDGGISREESARAIGFVMQDPAMQIVCDTVWHELAFGLENLGTPQDEMRRRVAEVAHFFGIEPWVNQSCEDLSGGQKQILNLAAVLALRPKLLLLDEPTAQLDPNALKRFLFLLARVNRELGITVIMTTHSPEDVQDYATSRIDLGDIGPLGTRHQLRDSLGKRWHRRATLLSAQRDVRQKEEALSLREVYFRYDRDTPWVLRGLDMHILKGSIHAVVGGNGCGKSTLIKLLAGIERPQRGRVSNPWRAQQAFMPQDPKTLFVCDTVAEELAEWRSRCNYTEADEQAALKRFGLEKHAAHHPYDLSGGQRQKLALAKLLLTKPQLLFLDEPSKGLDPRFCAEAVRLLRALADEGRTVVLVTHDLDFALAVADEVSMIFDGELACTEPVDAFFKNNLVYRPNEASRLFGALL